METTVVVLLLHIRTRTQSLKDVYRTPRLTPPRLTTMRPTPRLTTRLTKMRPRGITTYTCITYTCSSIVGTRSDIISWLVPRKLARESFRLRKNGDFWIFSPMFIRACLGKMFVLIHKRLKKTVDAHHLHGRNPSPKRRLPFL